MHKVEGAPGYFILIELNNHIYNITYHYEWREERSPRIDRHYVSTLNTIFDTPEFFGKLKTKVDKTKLFLEVFKTYITRSLPA